MEMNKAELEAIQSDSREQDKETQDEETGITATTRRQLRRELGGRESEVVADHAATTNKETIKGPDKYAIEKERGEWPSVGRLLRMKNNGWERMTECSKIPWLLDEVWSSEGNAGNAWWCSWRYLGGGGARAAACQMHRIPDTASRTTCI